MTREAQLEDLFRRYHSLLIYVLLRTCEPEIAEEAVCRTWVNMASARALPETVGKSYLLRSAKREAYGLIKAREDRDRWLAANGLLLTWVDQPVTLSDGAAKDAVGDVFYAAPGSVEEEALSRVEAGELLAAMAELPPAQREVIPSLLSGRTYQETADDLGLTFRQVDRRIVRGRRRLRAATG